MRGWQPSDLKQRIDNQLYLELFFQPEQPPTLPPYLPYTQLELGHWLVLLKRDQVTATLDSLSMAQWVRSIIRLFHRHLLARRTQTTHDNNLSSPLTAPVTICYSSSVHLLLLRKRKQESKKSPS